MQSTEFNHAACGNSLKWRKYRNQDIIPMWIADLDFKSAPQISQALKDFAQRGIFGYTTDPDEVNDAVVRRLKALYNWQIDPEWLVWVSGLVPALNIAALVADPDDDGQIITFTPVYPPFLATPKVAKKKLINIPMIKQNNHYTFDLDRFEDQITPKTKILLLCSPHNPIGRIFTSEELSAVAEICMKHNILICSDEVHSELLLDDTPHIPTATLSPQIAQNTITLMSGCKTFNLGGLNCGFAIIPNQQIRKKFIETRMDVISAVNGFGYAATIAAFTKCDNWKAGLLNHLRQNREIVEDFINSQIPELSMCHVQATYLAWIDATALKVDNPQTFFEKAGVGLNDGADFGQHGFVRLNFGCTKQTLLKALNRMKSAVEKHLNS